MSGSPILARDGRAIAVVSSAAGIPNTVHTEGAPNPYLTYHLSAGILREILAAQGSPALG
jgi:hypothetical protein